MQNQKNNIFVFFGIELQPAWSGGPNGSSLSVGAVGIATLSLKWGRVGHHWNLHLKDSCFRLNCKYWACKNHLFWIVLESYLFKPSIFWTSLLLEATLCSLAGLGKKKHLNFSLPFGEAALKFCLLWASHNIMLHVRLLLHVKSWNIYFSFCLGCQERAF